MILIIPWLSTVENAAATPEGRNDHDIRSINWAAFSLFVLVLRCRREILIALHCFTSGNAFSRGFLCGDALHKKSEIPPTQSVDASYSAYKFMVLIAKNPTDAVGGLFIHYLISTKVIATNVRFSRRERALW